jgi:hypothetical protein
MSTNEVIPKKGMDAIVAAGRAVMLMEPFAEDFNALPMMPPVRRIMTVAEVFNRASAANEMLEKLIHGSGVMSALRDEGRARGAGDIVVPQAFIPDFERHVAREVTNA